MRRLLPAVAAAALVASLGIGAAPEAVAGTGVGAPTTGPISCGRAAVTARPRLAAPMAPMPRHASQRPRAAIASTGRSGRRRDRTAGFRGRVRLG